METLTETKDFTLIWHSFSKGIETYFRQKTKDADLAKDLLQDTFLKIYLHRHSKTRNTKSGAGRSLPKRFMFFH